MPTSPVSPNRQGSVPLPSGGVDELHRTTNATLEAFACVSPTTQGVQQQRFLEALLNGQRHLSPPRTQTDSLEDSVRTVGGRGGPVGGPGGPQFPANNPPPRRELPNRAENEMRTIQWLQQRRAFAPAQDGLPWVQVQGPNERNVPPPVAQRAAVGAVEPGQAVISRREIAEALGYVWPSEEELVRLRDIGIAKVNVVGQRWCVVCNGEVFGDLNWANHLSGDRHRARIRRMTAAAPDQPGALPPHTRLPVQMGEPSGVQPPEDRGLPLWMQVQGPNERNAPPDAQRAAVGAVEQEQAVISRRERAEALGYVWPSSEEELVRLRDIGIAKVNAVMQRWCVVCDGEVFGDLNWANHLSSNRHRGRIRMMTTATAPDQRARIRRMTAAAPDQ